MIAALRELFLATVELGYRRLLELPCRLGRHDVDPDVVFCRRCGETIGAPLPRRRRGDAMTWEPEEKKLCNGEAFSLRYASGELPKRADVIELKSGPDGRDRRVAHVAADGTITVRIDGEGTYEPLDPAGYRLLDGRTVAETIRDARSALERLEGIAERYDERIAGDDTTSPGYSVRVAP